MKVLYADDNTEMRDYVSMLLEASLDCEIMEASSGNEAVSFLDYESDIDFAIFELSMKGGDGHLIVDYFDKNNINVPIVLMSDVATKEDDFVKTILSRHKDNFFIRKPFKDDEFFPGIEKLISGLEITGINVDIDNPTSKEKTFDWGREKKEQSVELEADWGREQKDKSAEVEADWGREKKEKSAEVEADWGREKKEKSAEVEADWGSEKKEKSAEVEADWGSEKKDKSIEVEADWGSDEKNKVDDVEADWGSEEKNKVDDFEADWVIAEKKSQKPNIEIKKKLKQEESPSYDKERFRRVRLKRFLNFSNVCCDAYIKLGDNKYVMLLSSHQNYDLSLIQKYHDKKVKYLYLDKRHYEDFINQFNGLVFSKLKQVKNVSTDIKVVAELAAFDSILNTAKEFGVSSMVASQVQDSINSVLETVNKLPALDSLLSRIMKGGSYISEHSLLLSYIAGQICQKTSWSSEATLSKLTMAALFHDITLSSDDLAKIHSLETIKDYDLTSEELKELKSHPVDAANLINAGENIFPDVDTIIIQHHEQPDGSGFPKGLGSLSISPLSCLFIIASDYVEELTNLEMNKKDLDEIKKEFEVKYSKGNFKKPLAAFLKCF